MNKEKKIIAFDFDGVICDSIHDSMMTTINIYILMEANHGLPVDRHLNQKNILSFEQNNPDFINQFRSLMPLGNFAQDYYVILKLICQKDWDKIKSQKDFNDYKDHIPSDILTKYNKQFYNYRSNMQKEDPDKWALLMPPFPGIVKTIRELSKKFLCVISTSKDINSVTILLNKYKLQDVFHPKNILDKDFAQSKKEHLIKFHNKYKIPFSNMHFIDDKVSHLLTVAGLGVKAHLATWGYNTPREHSIAARNGCYLLNLDDLKNLV